MTRLPTGTPKPRESDGCRCRQGRGAARAVGRSMASALRQTSSLLEKFKLVPCGGVSTAREAPCARGDPAARPSPNWPWKGSWGTSPPRAPRSARQTTAVPQRGASHGAVEGRQPERRRHEPRGPLSGGVGRERPSLGTRSRLAASAEPHPGRHWALGAPPASSRGTGRSWGRRRPRPVRTVPGRTRWARELGGREASRPG